METIIYKEESDLTAEEFQEILEDSGLDQRRPAGDLKRLKEMCKNANLIITARINSELIGVSRAITDFSYCTYLSDLAVHRKYQKQGIGKKLVEETQKKAPQATLILLSAPDAVNYYPKIGMEKHNHCYLLKRDNLVIQQV